MRQEIGLVSVGTYAWLLLIGLGPLPSDIGCHGHNNGLLLPHCHAAPDTITADHVKPVLRSRKTTEGIDCVGGLEQN